MKLEDKISLIEKEWKSTNIQSPSGFIAIDHLKNQYLVARDDLPIITLVSYSTSKVFMIPKKYCELKNKFYIIKHSSELRMISCKSVKSGLNKYDNFVLKILKKLKI